MLQHNILGFSAGSPFDAACGGYAESSPTNADAGDAMPRETEMSFSDNTFQLPENLRQLVEAELELGEQLRWVGMPKPVRFVMKALRLPIILLSIPAAFFLMVWGDGFRSKNPEGNVDSIILIFYVLFPLLLLGILFLIKTPIAWRNARRMAYVVTDRRAIVFDGGSSKTIRSFGPEYTKQLWVTQNAKGFGDVIFDYSRSKNTGRRMPLPNGGFLAIANVGDVKRLVMEFAPDRE